MIKRQTLLRRMLSCGLLATVLTVATRQASAADVTVRGGGTCRAYLDAKNNSVEETVKRLVWTLGYVSGLAVATQVDVLTDDDGAETMLKWVDAYCQAYPAKNLSDAGDLYFRVLKERIQASNDTEKRPVRREVR